MITENDFVKYLNSNKRIFPLEHIRLIASAEAKDVKNNMEEFGYDYSYPVHILEENKFFYMHDGHKRLSSILYCSLSVIPCLLVAAGPEEISPGFSAEKYINDSFKLKSLL